MCEERDGKFPNFENYLGGGAMSCSILIKNRRLECNSVDPERTSIPRARQAENALMKRAALQ